MSSLLSQITAFESEIAILLDKGNCISISEFESICDNEDIVDFIHNKYGFYNIESKIENQTLLKEKLSNIFISEKEANNRSLYNNGLVYLHTILFEMMQNIAYDYKFNYEDLISQK